MTSTLLNEVFHTEVHVQTRICSSQQRQPVQMADGHVFLMFPCKALCKTVVFSTKKVAAWNAQSAAKLMKYIFGILIFSLLSLFNFGF